MYLHARSESTSTIPGPALNCATARRRASPRRPCAGATGSSAPWPASRGLPITVKKHLQVACSHQHRIRPGAVCAGPADTSGSPGARRQRDSVDKIQNVAGWLGRRVRVSGRHLQACDVLTTWPSDQHFRAADNRPGAVSRCTVSAPAGSGHKRRSCGASPCRGAEYDEEPAVTYLPYPPAAATGPPSRRPDRAQWPPPSSSCMPARRLRSSTSSSASPGSAASPAR